MNELNDDDEYVVFSAMPTTTSTQSDSTIISVVVRRNQLDGSLRDQPADCSARADGNYQLTRCSDRFLSCSNGIGHLMNCPDQLVFNAQLDACDFPSALMCDEYSAGQSMFHFVIFEVLCEDSCIITNLGSRAIKVKLILPRP